MNGNQDCSIEISLSDYTLFNNTLNKKDEFIEVKEDIEKLKEKIILIRKSLINLKNIYESSEDDSMKENALKNLNDYTYKIVEVDSLINELKSFQ